MAMAVNSTRIDPFIVTQRQEWEDLMAYTDASWGLASGNDDISRYLRGVVHFQRFKESMKYIKPLPQKDEAYAQILIDLAVFHQGEKQYEKALELLNLALVYAPSAAVPEGKNVGDTAFSQALELRGKLLFSQGQFRECLADVDYTLAMCEGLTPEKLVDLFARQALCLMALKDFASAIHGLETGPVSVKLAEKNYHRAADSASGPLGQLVCMLENARKGLRLQQKAGENAPKTVLNGYDEILSKVAKKVPVEDPRISSLRYLGLRVSSAVRVDPKKDFGEKVVARTTINAGDYVLVEEAVTQAVTAQCRTTNCHHCLKWIEVAYPCHSCSKVVFCSLGCAGARPSRDVHAKECEKILPELLFLDIVLPTLAEPCIMAVRNILSKSVEEWQAFRRQRIAKFGDDPDPIADTFAPSLQPNKIPPHDHNNKLLALEKKIEWHDVKSVSLLAAYCMALLKRHHFKEGVLDLDMENYLGGLLVRYMFSFSTHQLFVMDQCIKSNQITGVVRTASAIFPTASLFGRSCDPNLVLIFHGNNVVARAWRKIQPGEVLTVATEAPYSLYISGDKLADRQQKMGHRTCTCRACTEEWPSHVEMMANPWAKTYLQARCIFCRKSVGPVRHSREKYECRHCQRDMSRCKQIYLSLCSEAEELEALRSRALSFDPLSLEESVQKALDVAAEVEFYYVQPSSLMVQAMKCSLELMSVPGNKRFRSLDEIVKVERPL